MTHSGTIDPSDLPHRSDRFPDSDLAATIETLGGPDTVVKVSRRTIQDRLGVSEWYARRVVSFARSLLEAPAAIATDRRLTGEVPIENLLDRLESDFNRKLRATDQGAHIVRIKDNLPIGIAHHGDPHVGDPGCNIGEIRRWMDVTNRTPGMYAATVGDISNNWSGRLAHLHKNQGVTEEDEFRLVRWYFEQQHWLYVIAGNHDHFGQGSVIFRQILRDIRCEVFEQHEARIELRWADASLPVARIKVRHDFKGSSQWNGAHGLVKSAKLDPWPDLLVCGHKHHYADHAEEINGRMIHAVRVGGFKTLDDYADALGYPASRHGQGCVTVHDPHASSAQRTMVFRDLDAGADYLTWLRHKRAR